MKIAIDVRMMWSSGIGAYIRNVVPGILVSRPQDRFYLLGNPADMERAIGFRAANADWVEARSPIFSLLEQGEMVRKTPRDTDLFWTPHYNFPVFRRGKLLVTVHDVFHLANPRFVSGLHRKFYARFMFGRLVERADSILCVSNFTKKELLRLAGGRPDKIEVIHNGVDVSWFNPKKGERPHAKPYLLFVGNVKPHKNLGRLLQAFDLMKDKIPHDLVLVGKKEGFITGDPLVIRQAVAFGDRVQFTGLLEDERLRQYYASADLLVFPSLYEGFGLPPLEAMATGTPVVCSNAASLPEVCGDAAEYFDPYQPRQMADKILAVLQNPAFRSGLVQKGLGRAKMFSWRKSIQQTSRAIGDVLGVQK